MLYLQNHSSYPNANKDRVALQTFNDVALFVDLACVDLVEEGHHDKGVEDDGEVLIGG